MLHWPPSEPPPLARRGRPCLLRAAGRRSWQCLPPAAAPVGAASARSPRESALRPCPAPARPAAAPVMAPAPPRRRRHCLAPVDSAPDRGAGAPPSLRGVLCLRLPHRPRSPGPKPRPVSAVEPPFGSALSARPSRSSSGAYVQAGTQPWPHGLCPPRLLSALVGRLLTALTWGGYGTPVQCRLHARPRGGKDQ